MFDELQNAKKHLLDYIHSTEVSECDNPTRRDKRCRRERVYDEVRTRDHRRTRDELSQRSRGSSRPVTRDETGQRRRHENADRKQSRDHRRSSQEHHHKSRKSQNCPGSEDPTSWKIIAPSDVDVSVKKFSLRFLKLFSFVIQSIGVLLLNFEVEDGNKPSL